MQGYLIVFVLEESMRIVEKRSATRWRFGDRKRPRLLEEGGAGLVVSSVRIRG